MRKDRPSRTALKVAYTDDAILMPPNHSPVEGKQAIEKYLAEIGSQLQASNFQLSILEVDVQGGTTIVRGIYSANFTIPGVDAPMEDRGKTLQVWKKQADGSWKIHRDIWNSTCRFPGCLKQGKRKSSSKAFTARERSVSGV